MYRFGAPVEDMNNPVIEAKILETYMQNIKRLAEEQDSKDTIEKILLLTKYTEELIKSVRS